MFCSAFHIKVFVVVYIYIRFDPSFPFQPGITTAKAAISGQSKVSRAFGWVVAVFGAAGKSGLAIVV